LRSVTAFGGRRRALAWLAGVVLVVLGAVTYANGLTDVFVGYNAQRSIRDNPDIRQLWPLWRAMSLHLVGPAALGDGGTLVRRPVLSLSFAANSVLFGPAPRGFQVINVAIHVTAALLLFGICRRTLDQVGIAFAIAALWLVHPLQTESVTYIPQRAESLMGAFFFLTLYCAIRAWQADRRGSGLRWQAAAIVACALGMATKEVMVSAPLVVWLYDAIFVSRSYREPFRRRGWFYLGLAATWIVLVTLLAATWSDVSLDLYGPRIVPYALSQPGVILHYLRLVVWPHPLFVYVNTADFWFHGDATSLFVPGGLMTACMFVTIYGLLRRHWIGFVGAWFFLTLAPTSSVIATSDVIQEHRMYLPLAAVIALAVVAARWATQRLSTRWDSRFPGRVATAMCGLVLAIGILATRARNQAYHSEFGAYAPRDLPAAYGITASYAFLSGNLSAAGDLFTAMLQLELPEADANYGQSLFHRARVFNALGAVRALQGRLPDARQCFLRALEARPGFAAAEANLVMVSSSPGTSSDGDTGTHGRTFHVTFSDSHPFDYELAATTAERPSGS
jgi:protein O-mannosyl-transferase